MLRNCKVDAVVFEIILCYNQTAEIKGGFYYEITG